MYIYRMRSVCGGTVYVSVSRDAEIALRDLGMQVGRMLTLRAGDGNPEYMISKSRVAVGEDPDPKYTIPVYGASSSSA